MVRRALDETSDRRYIVNLAAAILYIPANVLPIMHSHTVLHDTNDTIMSGIVSLWNGGSWPIAVLVFFASILVPTLKLISLSRPAFEHAFQMAMAHPGTHCSVSVS